MGMARAMARFALVAAPLGALWSLAACGSDTDTGGGGGGASTPTGLGGSAGGAASGGGGASSVGGQGGSGGGTPLTDACPAGADGLECLFAQHDSLVAACDPAVLAGFTASLEARHGELPAWREGRALFANRSPGFVAGDWNEWSASALELAPLCSGDYYVADTSVPSGRHPYQLVSGSDWRLDDENWSFAYDAFEGNDEGRNSILNTYDSGLGQLVEPDVDQCPPAPLSGCRRFVTYLPAGYHAPGNADRQYPVLFMHDGQNIYDDTDCCFGHTGWELNVTLDGLIAGASVAEVVVVGFPHGGDERGNEYAYSVDAGGHRELFMDYQVHTLQPAAAELWRLDLARSFVGGSSFGGLLSFHLMLAYPDEYVGAASLSGAFWPDDYLFESLVTPESHVEVALYQDWGASAGNDVDGYADNHQVLDLLTAAGWNAQQAPSCTMTSDTLCWYWDENAEHNELCWRDRAHLFLEYFFGL